MTPSHHQQQQSHRAPVGRGFSRFFVPLRSITPHRPLTVRHSRPCRPAGGRRAVGSRMGTAPVADAHSGAYGSPQGQHGCRQRHRPLRKRWVGRWVSPCHRPPGFHGGRGDRPLRTPAAGAARGRRSAPPLASASCGLPMLLYQTGWISKPTPLPSQPSFGHHQSGRSLAVFPGKRRS